VKNNCSINGNNDTQQPVLSLTDTSLKKVVKTDAEWKKVLTEQSITFCVKGTERPYQNELMTTIKLFCAACKLPLFSSKNKI
jgi:peptide-methionine (R)-S-oxide reductase